MNFGIVSQWKKYYQNHGVKSGNLIVKDILSGVSYISGVHKRGQSVFEKEWDLLIILDACRYDHYCEIVNNCEKHTSNASTSSEWMAKNFGEDYSSEVSKTAYITSNPHSSMIEQNSFEYVDEVWKNGWNKELGTVLPQTVTDRAISAARENDFERLIVHYMQPHFPFIAGDQNVGSMKKVDSGKGAHSGNVWQQIAVGNLSVDEILSPYKQNLEFVMESVEVLLENFDGNAVITADHANALGEYGVTGHPAYIPIDAIRAVPWDERTCVDSENHIPKSTELSAEETNNVESRLADLGYM